MVLIGSESLVSNLLALFDALPIEQARDFLALGQSSPLASVVGMDGHSSGITTFIMGALKRALNSRALDLGLYVCGGRGKQSRRIPDKLGMTADRQGLNGDALIRLSLLTAKIDNSCIADGFQIYLHSFIVAGALYALRQVFRFCVSVIICAGDRRKQS